MFDDQTSQQTNLVSLVVLDDIFLPLKVHVRFSNTNICILSFGN